MNREEKALIEFFESLQKIVENAEKEPENYFSGVATDPSAPYSYLIASESGETKKGLISSQLHGALNALEQHLFCPKCWIGLSRISSVAISLLRDHDFESARGLIENLDLREYGEHYLKHCMMYLYGYVHPDGVYTHSSQWVKIRTPTSWRPIHIGDELIGVLTVSKEEIGRWGKYKIFFIHKDDGTIWFVTGKEIERAFAAIGIGTRVRIVCNGSRRVFGSQNPMRMFDVYFECPECSNSTLP